MVQVVIVATLLVMAVAAATWVLYGQLGALFGTADTTLSGSSKTNAANDNNQSEPSGHSGGSDPNAIGNSLQQSTQQNTNAAAKAKGTP
jgi:hypothetical protein